MRVMDLLATGIFDPASDLSALEDQYLGPRALGEPLALAGLKCQPSDFVVTELASFAAAETGPFHGLYLQTTGQNTQWTAKQLASLAGCSVAEVGYCGSKDRHAVTLQWFSLPAWDGDWSARLAQSAALASSRLVSQQSLSQPVSRGQHQANAFDICLRFDGEVSRAAFDKRLNQLAEQGFPNYFGPQRFGSDYQNVPAFDRWYQVWLRRPPAKRKQLRKPKGIVLSSVRSWIFNRIVAARVQDATWNRWTEGDCAQDGAHETVPTGALWGRGRLASGGRVAQLEQKVMADLGHYGNTLEHLGLVQARRPLAVRPDKLSWVWQDNCLQLHFSLPPGAYATSLLRELVTCREPLRCSSAAEATEIDPE